MPRRAMNQCDTSAMSGAKLDAAPIPKRTWNPMMTGIAVLQAATANPTPRMQPETDKTGAIPVLGTCRVMSGQPHKTGKCHSWVQSSQIFHGALPEFHISSTGIT